MKLFPRKQPLTPIRPATVVLPPDRSDFVAPVLNTPRYAEKLVEGKRFNPIYLHMECLTFKRY